MVKVARHRIGLALSVLAVVGLILAFQGPSAQPVEGNVFDFDNGNAPIEVVIPKVIPNVYRSVAPGDATIVLRITTVITNAWFDAIAPYHPTAVGVYSRLDRQPASEATNRNKNIAAIYASYHALNSLLPQYANDWREMLDSVGLDPDDSQENTTSPIGIGNMAGKAVVAVREHDGMNQLGDEGGRTYNLQRYADYTGYEPVNSPFELTDPSRWQPQVITSGHGIYRVQKFVTPQLRLTEPYSYDNLNRYVVRPPVKSNDRNPVMYKAQVDEVLAASANLTDEQKMTAELFDDKLRSLGFSALFASQSNQLSLDEFVHYDFLTNVAAFDTSIAAWDNKHRYDSVRPFSAIKHLYGDNHVTAWGGPGIGTVSDLPASEWQAYLQTADHPEYPSASASFCAAHAQVSRLYFGTDNFGWSVPTAQGSSLVEPGITPANDIVLGPWHTWTEFEEACGMSRFWAGVHFMDSLPAGWGLGRDIGAVAYDFVNAHINGTAE